MPAEVLLRTALSLHLRIAARTGSPPPSEDFAWYSLINLAAYPVYIAGFFLITRAVLITRRTLSLRAAP
jgi:hypothetical protein